MLEHGRKTERIQVSGLATKFSDASHPLKGAVAITVMFLLLQASACAADFGGWLKHHTIAMGQKIPPADSIRTIPVAF